MEELLLFLKQKHFSIVLKCIEYAYIEGYIIEVNSVYTKIQTLDLTTIHVILLNQIDGLGLSNTEVIPGPCLFNQLPISFPPLCWTCQPKPSPLIIELLRLQQTMPPETRVNFTINAFEQISIQLQDIYSINQIFTFICMPAAVNPNIRIPIALVNSHIESLDISL